MLFIPLFIERKVVIYIYILKNSKFTSKYYYIRKNIDELEMLK